ncbi:hypothetical protein PILCRDRAFT_810588 [Piloderma croceum F 1598]|uniref:Cystathionine gamma-synthase n=1 Tax=Piloderma croceum (strain F 1598) TaxID=765440 RepID=A0A0C3G4Y5_PILCF|nr:hypothetical protein PILCRDRAFT_810588 [Piloderma croceum F 1598]
MSTLYRQPGLGVPVPPSVAHAISVSLPTWRDNVGYMEGEKRVMDAMASGYPRFVVHFSVRKLARICEQKFGTQGEQCLLFPTQKTADHCRAFLVDQSSQSGSPVQARLVRYLIHPKDERELASDDAGCRTAPSQSRFAEVHIVLFPADIFPLARLCWQHTGMGISSRYAEHCLSLMPEYIKPSSHLQLTSSTEDLSGGKIDYLMNQRCDNLAVDSAAVAKSALRCRIASMVVRNNPVNFPVHEQTVVTEDDVFLFPTGMYAVWTAYELVVTTRPAAHTICFGFPYTDTHKILQKWGPGCHFFGHGLDTDIDELENILEQEQLKYPSRPPALALFTEFPSNPLLRSADLPRLRALADKYNFPIIIDETIGNFVNVSVLPYADIIVSSMSKIFSGSANVTGGSLTFNPAGRHYQQLKTRLTSLYEDVYFDEDVICMELNSRDLEKRTSVIDVNTEAVCDFLRSHSIAGGMSSSVIKDILYPKWITRDKYDHCRVKQRKRDVGEEGRDGGFGGLFSITFTTAAASATFFDTLSCYKGPSLGTNFTLACPYTILAHYSELEWAAKYGVEETLVRISVGMEDKEALLRCMEAALKAAQVTSTSL